MFVSFAPGCLLLLWLGVLNIDHTYSFAECIREWEWKIILQNIQVLQDEDKMRINFGVNLWEVGMLHLCFLMKLFFPATFAALQLMVFMRTACDSPKLPGVVISASTMWIMQYTITLIKTNCIYCISPYYKSFPRAPLQGLCFSYSWEMFTEPSITKNIFDHFVLISFSRIQLLSSLLWYTKQILSKKQGRNNVKKQNISFSLSLLVCSMHFSRPWQWNMKFINWNNDNNKTPKRKDAD